MRAYHVYVFDGSSEITARPLDLITHIYACIVHRAANPDIPLSLITDERTRSFYDQWNITELYDEVLTDVFDDYPRQRISPKFWASPKIWAMSKLDAPFVILDTDLIFHKPIADYLDCDLLYLHRETTAIYPNIFDIEGPPGFVWDAEMARSFVNSQPMNCALVGIFNDEFRADFVKRYFDFVLDSTGELHLAGEHSGRMYTSAAVQIVLEQWYLAALADYWCRVQGKTLTTRAACKALHTSWQFFPLDMDLGPIPSDHPDLDSTFFHLWGAKTVERDSEVFRNTRDTLVGGRYIVDNSSFRDVLSEPFASLLAMLSA